MSRKKKKKVESDKGENSVIRYKGRVYNPEELYLIDSPKDGDVYMTESTSVYIYKNSKWELLYSATDTISSK